MLEKIFSRFLWTSLLCFFGGSVCAIAMAPYNVWGAFIVGFGVLYVALSKTETKKQAFALGWLFGFGYFAFGLYWIGNALLVEGNPYKWAWPLAVCGLPALLAFFPACGCLASKRFLNLKAWHGYAGFAVVMTAFEWLRGNAFTGFPWNLYGYTWADVLPVIQIVSLESVYSLTGLTIFWAGVVGFWFVAGNKKQSISMVLAVIVSLAAVYGYGAWRLGNADLAYHDLNVRIVQPNTPQAEKWERDKMPLHFKAALDLSRPQGDEGNQPTIIVWPETAISPAYLNDPHTRGKITEMLSDYSAGAELITGALRYEAENKTYHNSIVTIKQDGQISNVYDKSHLVPFGEYIPFQKFIPLAPVAQFTGMKKGSGVKAFSTLENLTYSAVVCYEVIFPKHVTPKSYKPHFMINVTNDSWYGDSPGPYQHFTITRFRAVEEGIPVIRAANSGISGVIGPYGRIIGSTDIMQSGALQAKLPHKI